jgi:hypothetical protein
MVLKIISRNAYSKFLSKISNDKMFSIFLEETFHFEAFSNPVPIFSEMERCLLLCFLRMTF